MNKVRLELYKTEEDIIQNEPCFHQDIEIASIPNEGNLFHYTSEYYHEIPENKISFFKTLQLSIGNYRVKHVMEVNNDLVYFDYKIFMFQIEGENL